MVFVTAGLGGGTGTGAAPVIAQTAKEMGILTVGIVTVPFNFEGRKRRQQAEEGLEKMRQNVDTLLVINNERLREITGNLNISSAFAQADDVLTTAAKGIAEVIAVTGSINVDFNDVKTVMKDSGVAIMGSAAVEGEHRATLAVQQALSSPLLNDNDISGAQYVLLNITYGDKEVLMDEITEITDYIQDEAGSTADVIWGHGHDASLGDKLSVTIIATGFQAHPITGFEKAPEKKIVTLEDDQKKEIVSPLSSPTQVVYQNNVTEGNKEEQPFLKTQVEDSKKEWNTGTSSSNLLKDTAAKDQPEMEFDWVLPSNPNTNTIKEVKDSSDEETEVVRFVLQDDSEEKLNLESVNARPILSPEEQQKRTQERLSKIQDYTSKLKKAEGITEFENEPAFVRRNINLDMSNRSTEENIGRFGVGRDDNGGILRNNNFLHDNVD
jgi:cell division protein FtsZ